MSAVSFPRLNLTPPSRSATAGASARTAKTSDFLNFGSEAASSGGGRVGCFRGCMNLFGTLFLVVPQFINGIRSIKAGQYMQGLKGMGSALMMFFLFFKTGAVPTPTETPAEK